MTFMIERLVDAYSTALGEHKAWRKLRASGSERPYEWTTRREAEGFVKLCYDPPGDKIGVRVVEVTTLNTRENA